MLFKDFMLSYQIYPKVLQSSLSSKKTFANLTMAIPTANVDPSNNTNKEEISQPLLKIQSLNLRLLPTVDQYPEQLQMLIIALNHFVLSTMLSSPLAVPRTWLSLIGSMVVFNKTTKVVTFQLTNNKWKNLTKR